MALVPLRVVLDHAAENDYGVAAFNVNNMEQIQAIMEAAEETDSPVIIQASRMRDGSRKITHITEVIGLEGDVITLQDIYIHELLGEDANGNILGRHRTTGIARPKFWDRAKYYKEEGRLAEILSAGEVVDESGRPMGENFD